MSPARSNRGDGPAPDNDGTPSAGGWYGYTPTEERPYRPWRAPSWSPPDFDARINSIAFSPDYAADLPLWGIDWQDPPFEVDLLNDLAALQDDFERDFASEIRWVNQDARDRWALQASALAQRLRAAVPPHVKVEVDLWPLT